MDRYKIVRFVFNGGRRVVKRGLTLEEAQEHCKREDTHGNGWFDGYEEDDRVSDYTTEGDHIDD